MDAALESFPEPVAVVGGDLAVREANAAFRALLPAAAPLGPALAEAARAVLEGRLPRAEVDAPAREGEGAVYRWTAVPVAGAEAAALLHARALPGAEAEGARERALVEENAILRAVLDSMPSLVFVKDRHGTFVMANKALADIHGMTVDEVVQRSQREVHGDNEETEWYLQVDREVIRTGKAVTLHETVTDHAGVVHQIVTTKQPIVRRSGEVQVVGFCLDITERLRAEEARDAAAAAARREAEEKAALAAELDRKLGEIEAQHRQILALSAPILDMGEDVIGVPLIGAFDEERAATLTEQLLAAITARQIRHVILDLTAVEALDDRIADRLLGIARAIALLGARAVITGIGPAVAQTLVALGVDLGGLTTMRTPRDALRALGRKAG